MEKNKLVKLAVAGLLIASTLPVDAQAGQLMTGTIVAAKCAEHGCGSPTPPAAPAKPKPKEVADNAADNNMYRSNSGLNNNMTNPMTNTQNYNTNRGDTTRPDYVDSDASAASKMTQSIMTKTELMNKLNKEGKAVFAGMDTDGQDLALRLASLDAYTDKNLAVKEAQRRINEQRGIK